MVAPTMALCRYLIGRSPMRMQRTQFAKASGRSPFTQALRLPRNFRRTFTMRTMGRDQEIPVALPPHVPQPPDEHACSERYGLTMWLQEGCSVEEYQEIAAKLETYAASIIVGCEQKPYASLVSGKRTFVVQNIKLTVLGCRQRERHRSTSSRARSCEGHAVYAATPSGNH